MRTVPGSDLPESVIVNTDERGVATVCLNRPERHNAFDDYLIAQLTDVFERCARDRDIRVIVLTGAGKSFSSGADLEWMRSMATYSHAENLDDARKLAGMLSALARLPKPTVARVNGAAYGGGVGLVCCCDVAIASRHARFALTEVRLGLAPAVISPYVIAAIGTRQCQRYFQTGEVIKADTAIRLGVIHETVEHEYLDSAVERQLRMLLKGGPGAQAANKQLIAEARRNASTEIMFSYTTDLIATLRASGEGQEGLSAFLEKRPAAFNVG